MGGIECPRQSEWTLSVYQDEHHGQEVENRAEKDEDMPNGMEVSVLFIVFEEIRPDGVSESFCNHKRKSEVGEGSPEGHNHDKCYPTHQQIEQQREIRMLAEGDELTDDSGNRARPKESEQTPTHPASQDARAYDAVRAGNHDVNARMIEDSQALFLFDICGGMVEGAARVHGEHACYKKASAEDIRPIALQRQADQRSAQQKGEDDAAEMRLCVGVLLCSRRESEVGSSCRTCGFLADGGRIAVLSGSGGELYCVHIDYCFKKFNMLYP